MKIAMSSQNLRNITGHAGMCRNFLLFDVQEREVTLLKPVQLTREQTFHELQDATAHPLDGVEMLISGGMGQGLFAKLLRRGIRPFITQETDPLRAIQGVLDGSLKADSEALCGEHEHEEQHGHAAHACGCSCGER